MYWCMLEEKEAFAWYRLFFCFHAGCGDALFCPGVFFRSRDIGESSVTMDPILAASRL